jgi:NADP-dependent 3-hydroxy acid dehydrogenase YdfG
VFDLKGRVAIVTGGNGGIGLGMARGLAGAGASIVVVGRNADKSHAAARELGKLGVEAMAITADVTDEATVTRMVQAARDRFGRVDILVNNAGTNLKERTLRELTPEAWDMMVSANLNGAFYCTKAVLPQMLDRKDGVIVNVVSVAGKRANPLGGAAYVAAKFGMGGLGLVLSNEEKDSGVRVSNVYPGEIDTPILAVRPKPVSEEQKAAMLKPEDVADAVFFVATLPARVSIPELVIKPTNQLYW